jgi:hypothetical protein
MDKSRWKISNSFHSYFFSFAGYAQIDVSISPEKAIEKAIEKQFYQKTSETWKLNLQEKGLE